MASSPLSLSSSSSRTWEHDVFPSFHGKDVRKNFLSHVLKEFERKAINFFVDNKIERGEFIGPKLKQAIRGSQIAVVLLSKNYASSSWCLDELVEIMKKESGQKVITVFYDVDPTDVKKQKGDFGKVFKRTCKGKDKAQIQTWRKALEGVATIAGYHSSNWDDETIMIEEIATDISKMLNHLTQSRDFDPFIGMGAHMEKIELLLRLDLDEVRMIGIWGTSGIGKTTIARFLFNQLCGSFQNSALMVNIRGNYPRPCLDEYNEKLKLQKEMLSQMINHQDIVISHLGVAQGRLGKRKVLLVLDDVDRLAQLEALAKNDQWFGPGSRIIITTEDLGILRAHRIKHIYKVPFPSTNEAFQMFCMYAFDQKTPEDGFDALAHEITYLAGKLPLGLKVMGSHFRGLSKEQWPMEVSKLRTNLNGDIKRILMFSYDALCNEDKDLFLHIACFFNRKKMETVEVVLAEKFKDLRQRLYVLEMKSIVDVPVIEYVDNSQYIEMHELLAQLGKEIVYKQHVCERPFLIDDNDTCEVLTAYTTTKEFERMYNLWCYLCPNQRLPYCSNFPMAYLRFINNLEFLIELEMFGSKLEKLWDGIKLVQNLERMDLSYSRNLKELPNLSMATKLKKLYLRGCSSLVELPYSIGNATNLKELDLYGCSSLGELPSSIGNATSLEKLILEECSSLLELPYSIGNATNLKELQLYKCSSLSELPSSIGNLTSLKELQLYKCLSLVELPSSIGNLTSLKRLELSECSSLVELPSSIGNAISLEELYLGRCSSLVELPSSIGNATNLKKLDISGLSSLVELPSSIGNATNLKDFDLSGCLSLVELPSTIGNLTYLCSLNLEGCSSLVSLPQLPDSLRFLDASNCESLEKLDCFFCNPDIIRLNFENCFKLNKEARDLIIQRSTFKYTIFPGGEMPWSFTYRGGYGSSVTVKLNQKPLRTKFKACILLDNNIRRYYGNWGLIRWSINTGRHGSCKISTRMSTEHLHVFEIEVEEVTSNELVFEFRIDHKEWEIKECGIMHLLEHHVDGDEEMCEKRRFGSALA